MTKRQVPIDQLLRWAYQDELPKDDLSAGEGGTHGYARLIELGTRVDETDVAYQRYAYVGEVHPDAFAIADAVKALGDTVIDWSSEARELMGPWFWMLEGEYAARAIRNCGKIVHTRALVVSCAARGSLPYWHDEPPQCGPHLVREGMAGRPSAVVLGGKPVKGSRGRRTWTWGSYCPVKRVPSATEIVLDRAEYVGWWRSLVSLQATLRGSLSDYDPIQPSVPERPWVDAPRVVAVFPVGKVTERILRLRPERAVAG
jgi:hypothetical protein